MLHLWSGFDKPQECVAKKIPFVILLRIAKIGLVKNKNQKKEIQVHTDSIITVSAEAKNRSGYACVHNDGKFKKLKKLRPLPDDPDAGRSRTVGQVPLVQTCLGVGANDWRENRIGTQHA